MAGENRKIDPKDLDLVSGGGDTGSSGISCPQCCGFVPVSMHQILTGSSLSCPHCGLQFDIKQK